MGNSLREQANFLSSVEEVTAVHGTALRQLIGLPIESIWVAWDVKDDVRFADEPVVIQIGEITNLEIVFFKFNELSISFNTIDLNVAPCWFGDWGQTEDNLHGFQLEWRVNTLPEFIPVLGSIIENICFVEYCFRTEFPDGSTRSFAWLLNGIEFQCSNGVLQIFNALDENGITSEPIVGDDFRRHYLITP